MNNFLYALILSSLAGLSTVFGGLLIFIDIPSSKRDTFLSFCLTFSMTVMTFISLVDLIPESFKMIENSLEEWGIVILALCAFTLCYILICYISNKAQKYSSLYKLGILSMIILMIHNFPEGILTFLSSFINRKFGIRMTIAIALHNIPEGISIAMPIYYASKSKKKALAKTLISGLSEPLGAITAYLFLSKYINTLIIGVVLLLVSGLMISLSVKDIYPEIQKYGFTRYSLLAIIIGIICVFISMLL